MWIVELPNRNLNSLRAKKVDSIQEAVNISYKWGIPLDKCVLLTHNNTYQLAIQVCVV